MISLVEGNPRGQHDALVVGVFEDNNDFIHDIDEQLGKYISKLLDEEVFKPELNSITSFPTHGKFAAERVFLLGLGKKDDLSYPRLRDAAGLATKTALSSKVKVLVFDHLLGSEKVLDSVERGMESLVVGATIGLYKFEQKAEPDKAKLESVKLMFEGLTDEIKHGFASGTILANAVCLTRDLVNGCPSEFTPTRLADEAQKVCSKRKMKCTVYDDKRLKKEGMNGVLAVGAGSQEESRLVIMEHKGSNDPPLVIVGKGISFDSGGLDIKPWNYMMDMKTDMSGAAAVIGAMDAIAGLKLRKHVIGIFASAENMPGNRAFKQGDIVKTFNGKTIEVRHTDAEGRVVLADALGYACTLNPTAVVDIATLTGAVVGALGVVHSGLFTEDHSLALQLQRTGEEVGETLWRLPLQEEYKKMVKSDVADVLNSTRSVGEAGSSTAAAFLSNFVNCKWAHLDIAGTAFREGHPTIKEPLYSNGATGVGVQLFVELARHW